jgi:hypothetical protein
LETKRCLFCEQTVPIGSTDDCYSFIGCFCAPDGLYQLRKDSYDQFLALPHQTKREVFPILSAYIRDLASSAETAVLAFDDLEAIRQSSRIPASIEEKEALLLKYLRTKATGPNAPVVIRSLASNYNLTYSPNLQEFVYVIEKLREKGWLERVGTTFTLTEEGWKEASSCLNGKRLKSCVIAAPNCEQVRSLWAESIFPRLTGLGYSPRFADHTQPESFAESKLLIADLTEHDREVYYVSGLAQGAGLPVIWTIKRGNAELADLPLPSDKTRLAVWDTVEELWDQLVPNCVEA